MTSPKLLERSERKPQSPGCLTALQFLAGCVAPLLWAQITWRHSALEDALLNLDHLAPILIVKKMGDYNLFHEQFSYFLMFGAHENSFAHMFVEQAYFLKLSSCLSDFLSLGIFTLLVSPLILDTLLWLPREQDQTITRSRSFSSPLPFSTEFLRGDLYQMMRALHGVP